MEAQIDLGFVPKGATLNSGHYMQGRFMPPFYSPRLYISKLLAYERITKRKSNMYHKMRKISWDFDDFGVVEEWNSRLSNDTKIETHFMDHI